MTRSTLPDKVSGWTNGISGTNAVRGGIIESFVGTSDGGEVSRRRDCRGWSISFRLEISMSSPIDHGGPVEASKNSISIGKGTGWNSSTSGEYGSANRTSMASVWNIFRSTKPRPSRNDPDMKFSLFATDIRFSLNPPGCVINRLRSIFDIRRKGFDIPLLSKSEILALGDHEGDPYYIPMQRGRRRLKMASFLCPHPPGSG